LPTRLAGFAVIDHKHRCIFIHQRKNAGMSIFAAFGYFPHQKEFHLYNDGILSPEWSARREEEQSYFVFSVVRNPFDRLISSWKYLHSTRTRTLLDALRQPPKLGHDYKHFTRPQIAILRDATSRMLVTNFLVRFEHLQDDFNIVCDLLGKPRLLLSHLNASQRQWGYRQYFDRETRQLAEAMFAEDITTFGYEF
jgi:Sulfotransferase family